MYKCTFDLYESKERCLLRITLITKSNNTSSSGILPFTFWIFHDLTLNILTFSLAKMTLLGNTNFKLFFSFIIFLPLLVIHHKIFIYDILNLSLFNIFSKTFHHNIYISSHLFLRHWIYEFYYKFINKHLYDWILTIWIRLFIGF